MENQIPNFPKAETMMIHSGNIVNWSRLKRKLTQTPSEELAECISGTLEDFLSKADKTDLQYVTELECLHSQFIEALPADEREGLKVTVKISMFDMQSPDCLQEAINKILWELGIQFVETVLLSFPERDEELTLAQIEPYWRALEAMVEGDSPTVLSIGVSDLTTNQLKQLYEWAEVKPIINQVNLASCCVMPPDMIEYAKLNDIQLLTHSDPPDLLPQKTFRQVIASISTNKDAESWNARWSVRYSVLVKCRGIVKTKGYIVKAQKGDLEKL